MLAPEIYRIRYLLLAALFSVATAAALSIDLAVARWADADGFRRLGDFDQLVTWSEVFAHGVGVSVILLTVYVLDANHRRTVLRLGVLSLGAGLVTNLTKRFVTRTRPMFFDLSGNVTDTFASGFPELFDDQRHSFPSGHTTAAVGLAIGLSWRYPRGRWLFVFFAVCAAMQRWSYRAHFVSDSCGGAVVAFLVASVVLGASPVQRWFARFEAAEKPTSILNPRS